MYQRILHLHPTTLLAPSQGQSSTMVAVIFLICILTTLAEGTQARKQLPALREKTAMVTASTSLVLHQADQRAATPGAAWGLDLGRRVL